jgi:hypothetical protein
MARDQEEFSLHANGKHQNEGETAAPFGIWETGKAKRDAPGGKGGAGLQYQYPT